MTHIVVKYAIHIVIGYMLLVLVVFLLQRKLLYFPDHTKPDPEQLATLGLKIWPGTSEFTGFLGTHAPDPAKGTIIVFHGNAGAAWHRNHFVHALEPMGYRIILAEYPGYGGRTGEMNEQSFTDDARQIVDRVKVDYGDPIYLMGESMGCGIAAAVAADRADSVAGLVLITPWDSLPSLAQTHYWYLPARWLVKDRYDSIHNLRSFNRSVAVTMAQKDEVIPNKHTLNLFNALPSPKKLWRFDTGHNNWPTAPDAPWWREVMSFVAGQTDR